MIEEINSFLGHFEPIWLLLVLLVEGGIGYVTLTWVQKEFFYDKSKDDQKQSRKTRTSKKTTHAKDGTSSIEEVTETTEPVLQSKVTEEITQ